MAETYVFSVPQMFEFYDVLGEDVSYKSGVSLPRSSPLPMLFINGRVCKLVRNNEIASLLPYLRCLFYFIFFVCNFIYSITLI